MLQQLQGHNAWPKFNPLQLGRHSTPRSAWRLPTAARASAVQQIVEGSCYEDIIDSLAHRAASSAQQLSSGKYIVGIAGGPGSGKSTLSTAVCHRVNALYAKRDSPVAVVVPMDGFHHYKSELDQMPDPVVVLGHKIVLVEGNYLLLEEQPWRQLRPLFNETWFVDCPVDAAMERVFRRQVSIGLAPEVSQARITGNDRPNAEQVAATKQHAQVLVPSTVPFRQCL